MASPYENLPLTAFWRSGVAGTPPTSMVEIYKKKWKLTSELNVATAGSCFAQHISRYMRRNGFSVMDVELAPPEMSQKDQEKYGYGLYSARYGNIYTVHQLLQLTQEAFEERVPQDIIWEKKGRYYDALRPAIQPGGFETKEALLFSRKNHLANVKKMLLDVDVFVFTLGLTEAWLHRPSGTVFPTAPETVAGIFDPLVYEFKNFNFYEITTAFNNFLELVQRVRGNKNQIKVLLTVSPVPLTATAAGKHILQASTYSKSVLRAVAGYMSDSNVNIDYFPSYEIITNPSAKSEFYDGNLRTVKPEGVAAVMKSFFIEHGVGSDNVIKKLSTQESEQINDDDVQCEEVLLEAFSKKKEIKHEQERKLVVFFGDSHLSGLKNCIEQNFSEYQEKYEIVFVPTSWMSLPLTDVEGHQNLTSIVLKDEYKALLPSLPTVEKMRTGANICFVGLGILGDGVIRAHGAMSPGEIAGGKSSKGSNPIMPIIGSKSAIAAIRNGTMSIQEIDGFEKFRRNYVHNINVRKDIRNKISASGIYSSVYWIASPNMVERTARFRFGDKYVESQAHNLHTRIAESYIDQAIIGKNENGWLITHPPVYEAVSGFTENKFAFSDAVNDIHTSAEFYLHAVKKYFESI